MKRARGELHAYFERSHRAAPPRDPQDDLVSELDRAARSTARRSPRSSCSPTASCSSRPATRPPATRSAADCSRSASTAPSGRSCATDPELLPGRGRGDPALGQPDQPLHARRDRGLRDPRRRHRAPATSSRCTSRRRTATRTCSTIRSRSASTGAEPAPRVRLRRALLPRRAPGTRRARDDLPAPARPPRVVRAGRAGRAVEVGGQRQYQATTAALPLGVARVSRGHTMELRPFGQTGIDVSAVGYGCWEIGGGYGDIEETEFDARRRAGRSTSASTASTPPRATAWARRSARSARRSDAAATRRSSSRSSA